MDAALDALFRRIVEWEGRVRDIAVTPRLERDALHKRVAGFDFSRPRALETVVNEVADLLETGTLHPTHPRYFGLFNPGSSRAGVVGDALAAVYNPQVGARWHSPAATEIEQLTLEHFRRRIGLESPEPAATFTTGGSEANLTAVLVALTRAFPRYAEEGLAACDGWPAFYASDQAHDSFVKIAHAAGLGRRALRRVRSDGRQRLDVDALRREIARDRREGRAPFLVIATVGTTATGAIDPLPELAALCRDEGLWLHADAAWGGLAVLSDSLRRHLAGIQLADSITWDAHKTLPVPMGAGMFFCRWRRSLEDTFSVHTSYLPEPEPGTSEAYQHSIQWSRRFIGLKIFLTLAELGQAGVGALIDHQAAMGRLLRESLAASGWRVTNDSPLPLVCFTRDGVSPDAIRGIARAVATEGAAWISELHLPSGERWLRACITHHRTTAEDVQMLVDAATRAFQAIDRLGSRAG